MSLNITFKTSKDFEGLIPEPIPAYKFFPEWFSKLPKSGSKCPFAFLNDDIYNIMPSFKNMSGCLGIQDFLKFGYIIPSWTSFVFRENFDGGLYVNWTGPPIPTEFHVHGSDQFPGMKNPPLYDQFNKFESPWVIQTSAGVSCLITDPIWHRNKNFTTSTGVFHTDKSPLTLPWFFEWNHKINSKMNLNDSFDTENQVVEMNEPIILVVPFYRKNFNQKIQYVDHIEFSKFKIMQVTNTHKIKTDGIYRTFRKKIKNLFT